MDSVPIVTPLILSGSSTESKGNWNFVSGEEILTAFGRTSVMIINERYSVKTRVKLGWKTDGITVITVSLYRDYIGIAHRGNSEEPPSIFVYNIQNPKNFKHCNQPVDTCTAKEFVSMSFTNDCKFINAILGAPDWLFLTYNWKAGVMLALVKVVSSVYTDTAIHIIMNQFNNNYLLITGRNVVHPMILKKGRWEDFGYQCRLKIGFTSGCWLSEREYLVSTDDGRIIMFGTKVILQTFYAATFNTFEVPILFYKNNAPGEHPDENLLPERELTEEEINKKNVFLQGADNLVIYENILAFTFGFNLVHIFRSKKQRVWVLTDIFILNVDMRDIMIVSKKTPRFTGLSVNTTKDKVLVSLSNGRAYIGELFDIAKDLVYTMKKSELKLFEPSLNHTNELRDVKACLWKPVFVTIGSKDGLCKLWSYSLRTTLFSVHYKKGVYSVSLHPSGFYCLLGLRHDLELSLVIPSGFKSVLRFDSRKCRISSFSENGEYFAYTKETFTENKIYVYSVKNLELLQVFKHVNVLENGNLKIIRTTYLVNEIDGFYPIGQSFKSDADEKSTGANIVDGGLSQLSGKLSVTLGKYLAEYIFDDNAHSYKFLREIVIPSYSKPMAQAGNAKICGYVVIGFQDGCILATLKPHEEPFACIVQHYHASPITRIVLARNDSFMLTADSSGAVIIWRVGNLTKDENLMIHIPDEYASKEFIFSFDKKSEADILRQSSILSNPEYRTRLLQLKIEAYIQRPINDNYEAMFKAHLHKARLRAALDDYYAKRKKYEHHIEMITVGQNLLKTSDEIDTSMCKLIKKFDKHKRVQDIKADNVKLNRNSLLRSARYFNEFFNGPQYYTEFYGKITNKIYKTNVNYDRILLSKVRIAEKLINQLSVEMGKEFKAKFHVLKNLEYYLRSQIGVIIFLKREVLSQKLVQLDQINEEIVEYLNFLNVIDHVLTRMELIVIKRNIIKDKNLFRENRRKIISVYLQTISDEYRLRKTFVNFNPEYRTAKIHHSDAVIEATLLQQWKTFKKAIDDYMLLKLIYESNKSLREENLLRKKLKRQPSRLKIFYKKTKANDEILNRKPLYKDAVNLISADIKGKGDNFYKLFETAVAFNTADNMGKSYLTKLLVLSTFKTKPSVSKDIIYNVETYDICLKLINEKEA